MHIVDGASARLKWLHKACCKLPSWPSDICSLVSPPDAHCTAWFSTPRTCQQHIMVSVDSDPAAAKWLGGGRAIAKQRSTSYTFIRMYCKTHTCMGLQHVPCCVTVIQLMRSSNYTEYPDPYCYNGTRVQNNNSDTDNNSINNNNNNNNNTQHSMEDQYIPHRVGL